MRSGQAASPTIQAVFFALGCLAAQACSSSDTVPTAPNDADDAGEKAAFPSSSGRDFATTLEGVVAAGVAPGVSLTVEHPSYETWSGAAGVSSLKSGKALTPALRFRAGSMLKMAIATAVLQLVEQEELALDAKLTTLLPKAITTRIVGAKAITLRMLLNHTSGIPDFATEAFDAQVAMDPTHVWTFDELLGRALSQAPVPAPRGSYAYTNTGYILLGKILEQTTGQPWRTTIRERVFARAKLTQSELPEEGNARCSGCSRGYESIDDELVDLTEVDPSMSGAAGGDALITTTQDLAKFLRALTAGQMFDAASTLDLMLDFADAEDPEQAQTGYGLGLARFQAGDVQLIGHLGGTAGFQGFVFFHPGTGIVASGYMNRRGDFGAFIQPVLDALTRMQ